MKRPTEPSQDDCCNSGCNPCIFDVYEKQLQLYEKYLNTGDSGEAISRENAISQLECTVFFLIERIVLCNSHVLLVFKSLNNVRKTMWNAGDHFLFKYQSEEHPCTRAYTPVKLDNRIQNKNYDFSIIVKKYCEGLVSSYLYGLEIGQKTLWRGPYGSYKIASEKFNRIIMIAQGTGIVPFFNIVNKILNDEDNMTILVLNYCCTNEDEILLRDEWYSFKSYWNFSYKIFLSKNTVTNSLKYEEPIEYHRLSTEDLNVVKPFVTTDQFLICGSTQFMKCFEKALTDCNVLNKNIELL